MISHSLGQARHMSETDLGCRTVGRSGTSRTSSTRCRGHRKGDRLLFVVEVSGQSYSPCAFPAGSSVGQTYHVINHGNGGVAVFHKDGITNLPQLLAMAMPNHFMQRVLSRLPVLLFSS